MGHYKPPIIDKTDQAKLLRACNGDNEYVPIWLMLRLGVPAAQLQGNGPTIRQKHIYWLRENNAVPGRATIPDRIAPRIKQWIATGKKRTPGEFSVLISRIGARIGHAEYSIQTLWNSSGVNQLRDALDEGLTPNTAINLVAERMDRKVETVKDLFLDYDKWVNAGGPITEYAELHKKGPTDAS